MVRDQHRLPPEPSPGSQLLADENAPIATGRGTREFTGATRSPAAQGWRHATTQLRQEMRLGSIIGSHRRQELLASAAVALYEWRVESVAVRNAYRRWMTASRPHEPLAFHLYEAALAREEQAARNYQRMTTRASLLADIGLVGQLKEIHAGPGT